MFKVEFEDNSYKRTTIGTFNTIEEANIAMKNFITQRYSQHGWQSPYWRGWEVEPYVTCIDFGSHSEFFYVTII